MKSILASLLVLTSIAPADQAADAQASILDQSSQKHVSSNKHPDAQWFPDAGLGLFIHWGIASVGASGDISWGMLANKPWKDKTVTPNTYYGKIDLIWFDGGKGEISNSEVHRLQPGIVINRRNGGGGDYGDSEGKLPENRFTGWFETCETSWPAGKWSYTGDWGWDSAPETLEKLVRLRAWGGNLLANVGPMGDGSMPMQALTAWKEMADWMKHSRESVIGAGPGPFPESVNAPVTTGKGAAYVHFLPAFNEEVIWNNAPKYQKATLLRTGMQVPINYQNGKLRIMVPPALRTKNVDVLKLE